MGLKQNRNIMTVAWVFPGQGSQKIGMAKQIAKLPNTKERFSYASEIFKRNLFEICDLNTEPIPEIPKIKVIKKIKED